MSFVEKEGGLEPAIRINCKKPIIKRRDDINIPDKVSSDLGKRKITVPFGPQIYNDKERYGQDITDDFFKTNIGHNVYEEKLHLNEAEILDWCYKYLASKKIQI